MPFEPDRITRDHVLNAIRKIENEKIALRPSTRYSVFIEGREYPPKEVMRYAHEQMNGEKVWWHTGGEPTNRYLSNLGFKVDQKYNPSTDPNYLTGTVMKLGCNWGRGAPSFYQLIKERRIVISNSPFSIGDLVMITEGFQVMAIARVLEEFEFALTDPSLEKPFEELQIDYDDSVSYARAEWYELPKDKQFQYQLQAGIRMVQDPEMRNRVTALWKEWNTPKPAIKTSQGGAQPSTTEETVERIKEVQGLLKKRGLYLGEIDGVYAPVTMDTLIYFQRLNGLRITGEIDSETLAKLREPQTSDPGNSEGTSFWLLKVEHDNLSEGSKAGYLTTSIKESSYSNIKPGDNVLPYEYIKNEDVSGAFVVDNVSLNAQGLQLRIRVSVIFNQPVPATVLRGNLLAWDDIVDRNNRKKLFPLTEDEFQRILSAGRGETVISQIVRNELKKAALDNDEAFAPKDYLGFDKDIRAFAAIMAMKDVKPPLAIALFGQWGTGKSFFMHHLRSLIRFVSTHQCFPPEDGSAPAPVSPNGYNHFCEGIVQIPFNAWSYLDSNLWAGLVSTILEKLDTYISEYSKTQEAKNKVHKTLSEKLSIVSDQKRTIIGEREKLEKRKETLETQIEHEKRNKNAHLTNIKYKTLTQIVTEVEARFKPIPEEITKKLEEFGITEARLKELSPATLFEEFKSWSSFFTNLFKFKTTDWIVLLLAILGLAYLIVDPYGDFTTLKANFFKTVLLLITIGGPAWAKVYRTFKKYKTLLQPITDLKNTFNKEMAAAEFAHEQRVRLLQTELAAYDKHIVALNTQLTEVQEKIDDVEYALRHSVTRLAFDDFIRERRGDVNYEKHLGIISTIRRDFETLSTLFHESLEEAQAEKIAGQDTMRNDVDIARDDSNDRDADTQPGGLRQYFKKPLDRIILYIDDLDRCPDEKVMEVLQAVHLLMAFPLFIVVVGVDKRCVQNALRHKNFMQYKTYFKEGNLKEQLLENGIDIIEPNEYLEKIFQIPFHIEEATQDGIKNLVKNLLRKHVQPDDDVEKRRDTPSALHAATPPDAKVPSAVGSPDAPILITTGKHKAVMNMPQPSSIPEPGKPLPILPGDLLLTTNELDCLIEITTLVSKTPRTIKRFINMYRIIRAHELLSYDKSTAQESFLAIMFTVALNTGDFKDRADSLFDDMLADPGATIKEILDKHAERAPIATIVTQNDKLKGLLNMKCSRAIETIRFTRRFSFGG